MPEDGLDNTPLDTLNTMLHTLRERATDLQSKRSYVQMEKDMIEQFFKNCLQKKDDISKKLFLWENKMQTMESEHKMEVKMYLQRMKHLELERDNNTNKVMDDGKEAVRIEDEWHQKRIEDLKKVKFDSKVDYIKKEDEDGKTVENTKKEYHHNLENDKKEKMNFLANTEKRLNEEVEELKAKLELKLKVEIHEIEERKNNHINDLKRNHEASFNELKTFYNDITVENLELIKKQNAEIAQIRDKHQQNAKEINLLKQENKSLEVPLRQARRDRKILQDTLKQYEKDKMSLGNLKVKLVSLKEKLEKLKKDKSGLENKMKKCFDDKDSLSERFKTFANQIKANSQLPNPMAGNDFEGVEDDSRGGANAVQNDRNGLINKFNVIANQMKSYVELQNYILAGDFEKMENELRSKEYELTEIVETSKLDPYYVEKISKEIRGTVDQKNAEIKNLKYLIQHATKAYNDAIRVYGAKLEEFGIPPNELGFLTIESKTSTMPAGLVSS